MSQVLRKLKITQDNPELDLQHSNALQPQVSQAVLQNPKERSGFFLRIPVHTIDVEHILTGQLNRLFRDP